MRHQEIVLCIVIAPLAVLLSVQVTRAQAAGSISTPSAVETVESVHETAFRAALATALGNKAAEDIAKAPSATTAPDGFATRIHNSYQDYLNLLSFAINQVDQSTDGQSLIIRFNPFQSGRNRLGITGTFSKPTVYAPIANAIPESVRDSTVALIKDQQSDLEDATISLAYSLDTERCSLKGGGRCYGRDPRTYRNLLSNLMLALAQPDTSLSVPGLSSIEAGTWSIRKQLDGLRPGSCEEVMKCPIASFANAGLVRELASKLGALDGQGTALQQRFYKAQGFATLENLVDNQPQLSVVGSYHTAGKYGGPDEWSLGLDLQVGSYNINRLRRDSGGETSNGVRLLKSYTDANSGMSKLVFSVSYKSIAAFRLTQLDLGTGPLTGFTPLDQKSTSELTAKLQWGTKLEQKVGGRQPRLDVSLDGIRALEGSVRTTNRWVATTTLTIPLGDTINVPVSIAWANKPEFLSQPNQRLGAHLGLTYRLPWEKTPSP